MDDETKLNVTDTVISILDNADMDVMTEFKVRQQASNILSIDLSQPEPKQYVRRIIKAYLDDRATTLNAQLHNKEADAIEEDKETKPPLQESEQVVEEEEEEEVEDDKRKSGSKEYDDDGDLIVCRLSDKRRVTIQDFKGKTLVSIREYYTKDGKELPSS